MVYCIDHGKAFLQILSNFFIEEFTNSPSTFD